MTRNLTAEEAKLLEFLVAHSTVSKLPGIQEWVANCMCEDLPDEGMGSIRLVQDRTHDVRPTYADTPVQYEFDDADGIKVIVSLNVATDGYPFEVEFWKVNFEPRITFPMPDDLRLLERIHSIAK